MGMGERTLIHDSESCSVTDFVSIVWPTEIQTVREQFLGKSKTTGKCMCKFDYFNLCHVAGHSILQSALFVILWHFHFRALNTKIMSASLYPPSAVLQKSITLVFKNLKVSMKTKTIIIKCNNRRVD